MAEPAERCFYCLTMRNGKWALLFGIPQTINGETSCHDVCEKRHVCPDCYEKLTTKESGNG